MKCISNLEKEILKDLENPKPNNSSPLKNKENRYYPYYYNYNRTPKEEKNTSQEKINDLKKDLTPIRPINKVDEPGVSGKFHKMIDESNIPKGGIKGELPINLDYKPGDRIFIKNHEINEKLIEIKTDDTFQYKGKIFRKYNRLNKYQKKDNIKRTIYKCILNRHSEKLRAALNKKCFCNATIEYIQPDQNIKSGFFFKIDHSEECYNFSDNYIGKKFRKVGTYPF